LLHLGQFALWRGDDADAREQLEQSLVVAREIGNREIEGECELLLGEAAFEADELGEARGRFERSMAVCLEAADTNGEARAKWWLGRIALNAGDARTARLQLNEALRAFQASEMREELIGCLEDHAVLLLSERRPADGMHIAAMAAATRERLKLVRSPRGEATWQQRLESLRAALPGEAAGQAWEEGQRWSTDEAALTALAPAPEGR
jgi:hypothetical protein